MNKFKQLLWVSVFCLFFVAACGGNENGPLTNDEAIDIAAHHLMGKSFDKTPPSTVSYDDGKYTVIFEQAVPGGAGDTYTTKVIFDGETKELLEVEVNTDATRADNAASGFVESAGRNSPLNEEVDQVEALRKQVMKQR